MNRQLLRHLLTAGLVLASLFALWVWFRPYEIRRDPAARSEIISTLVTPDKAYFWVEIHLKLTPGTTHDLQQPVFLKTATATQLNPAETTMGSPEGSDTPNELWFKFWLETPQINGPLTLHLNGGTLTVKSTTGTPQIPTGTSHNFVTHRW